MASPAHDAIRRALVARHPVIGLVSWEEERVEGILAEVARTAFSSPARYFTWSRTLGLVGPDGRVPDTQDPVKALDVVITSPEPALFVFRDVHEDVEREGIVRRKLRDVRRELEGKFKFLFLVSPRLRFPHELSRDVTVIDVPLPTPDELGQILDKNLKAMKAPQPAVGEQRQRMLSALQGLTLIEAQHALHRALFGRDKVDDTVMESLFEQKEQLARKDGVLEYVPQRWNLHDIGGLETLKDWLVKREKLFNDESAKARMLVPKGLLMMGVSGCGKSLSVKAISSLWNLPLFRLDMNQVFSSVWGTPEEAFDRALKTMESLAPAILWLDEIEGGINREGQGSDAGTKGRIFSAFLTWMQEKNAKVFVAATANRIDLLPAELLRKGRFDQIFFIDLPTEAERGQIFSVHLHKRGIDSHAFDLNVLAKSTKNWNGAEIEQCVISAMVEAYAKDEPVDEDDLFLQIGKIVPLATTMSEQIKGIKSWAHDRAVRASPQVLS
jgi:ATP-dependent 26S proteasome regulatory subunit